MIRSAAKNYQDVAVVSRPPITRRSSRKLRSNGGSLSPETHWRLAQKAFRTTADYDRAISARLARRSTPQPAAAELDIRAPQAHGSALRRKPAPVGRALRHARRRNRRRGATAGQGTFLQQPGGSGRRLAAGAGIRAARPRRSSSTPIHAAAPSRRRWPRAIARRSNAIPFRRMAA